MLAVNHIRQWRCLHRSLRPTAPAEQHAYRANFSACMTMRLVHSRTDTGRTQIIEGDLSGDFDSTPHAELLKSVTRRVSDGQLLYLIEMWLLPNVCCAKTT